MPESIQPTILKDLYVELGKNFRHFLAWRRFLFAGYFAIIAGIISAFDWGTKSTSYLNPFLLLVAIVITLLFWVLDVRNRQLIRNVSDAGVNLEKKLGLGERGSYSIYKNEEHLLTHSGILALFYIFSILAFTTLLVAAMV